MTVTTLEPALTKKLLLLGQPKQRITGEAVLMANELLRLFIVEARQRAAIEVGDHARAYRVSSLYPPLKKNVRLISPYTFTSLVIL
jgi:hypothetical protein